MKKTLAALLAMLLLIAGCSSSETSSGVVIPEPEKNQAVFYGKVTAAVGNEITLAVGIEKVIGGPRQKPGTNGASQEMKGVSGSGKDQKTSDEKPSGEIPSGGMPSGGMPSGGMPSGGMPSGGMPSGGMPSGGMPSGEIPSGEIPSGMERPDSGGIPKMGEEGGPMAMGIQLDLTGEERELVIPVGVPVYMAMGTRNISTDFSQITANLILKVVTGTDSEGKEYIAWLQIMA